MINNSKKWKLNYKNQGFNRQVLKLKWNFNVLNRKLSTLNMYIINGHHILKVKKRILKDLKRI